MESERQINSQSTLVNSSHESTAAAAIKALEGEAKPKVIVIMGPTASGKSKLAVDLASKFPIEIINADSMQVYRGLDVLTNKIPLHERNGVPHHLLGTISPAVEFTAKHFRDSAIPIIDDIVSRNCLPVIVGGTNYYIQALVSPFLLDDTCKNLDESLVNDHLGDEQNDLALEFGINDVNNYNYLKELDPIAANRVHPNDNRKINQYINLYAQSGVLPSKIYQGKATEGRIGVRLTIVDTITVLSVLMLPSLYWINMWEKE